MQNFNPYHTSSSEKVIDSDDYRYWSIDHQGCYTVKSLSVHFYIASPMDKGIFKALWKSSSPRGINILVWIMAFGLLNCSEILQKKSPKKCLLPSVVLSLWRLTRICFIFLWPVLFHPTAWIVYSLSLKLIGFLMGFLLFLGYIYVARL